MKFVGYVAAILLLVFGVYVIWYVPLSSQTDVATNNQEPVLSEASLQEPKLSQEHFSNRYSKDALSSKPKGRFNINEQVSTYDTVWSKQYAEKLCIAIGLSSECKKFALHQAEKIK